MTVTTLRTRKPTKKPSWPLILLAGEAKTGKTYRAAELSGDERIGRAFFLDLGEGSADEYGAVPGADYEIIDHDGTWVDIIGQVEAVRDVAQAAIDKGEKPVLLVIDSMTAEWAMLSQWADTRARRSKNNRKLLTDDPDAEIDITSNYWNDSTSRHNRLMNILKFFPGVVVVTALETEKTQFGPGGRPLEGAPKVAKPDGQKRLTADASVWVRLSLTDEPVIVGIRSLKHNITPGKDKPQPWPGFTLGGLVFDFLGLGGGTAEVRNTPKLNADQVMPDETPSDDTANTLRIGVDKTLGARSQAQAEHYKGVAERTGLANHEVGHLLTDEDRETLGITGGVTLLGLASKVTEYCTRHGQGAHSCDGQDDTPAHGPRAGLALATDPTQAA
ncbi:MAG TPA: AAA family ATPase [Pseudonocardiaceae bacterium]|jgi:hypothetical protein